MNSFEAKQEARRARLEAAAERAEQRASAAYERADLREEKSVFISWKNRPKRKLPNAMQVFAA